jgi:hypothetical protein
MRTTRNKEKGLGGKGQRAAKGERLKVKAGKAGQAGNAKLNSKLARVNVQKRDAIRVTPHTVGNPSTC